MIFDACFKYLTTVFTNIAGFLIRFRRLFDAIRLQLALRLKQRLGGSASPNLTYGILQQASGTPLFISFQAVQLQVISFKFYMYSLVNIRHAVVYTFPSCELRGFPFPCTAPHKTVPRLGLRGGTPLTL